MESLNIYRSDKNKEITPSKLIIREDGAEIMNNSGDMKIILSKVVVHTGHMDESGFVSNLYYMDENGWQKANESQHFNSIESFLHAMEQVDEFTQAFNEKH